MFLKTPVQNRRFLCPEFELTELIIAKQNSGLDISDK